MKDTETPLLVNGVLLLYHHYLQPGAATILEHVESFEQNSCYPVWKINTELGFPEGLSKLQFKVIVLHYSLFAVKDYYLNDRFRTFLKLSTCSYKIAFFQDENRYCQQRFAFLDEYCIQCVFTLLEPAEQVKVYGHCHKIERLVYTLTGYVNNELNLLNSRYYRADSNRKIDFGYRARSLPPYMGAGAMEKTQIAFEFRRRLQGSDFTWDIETGEDSRIYGKAWYQFLANCKAVLGVEAGVSIFDLTDEVRLEYERLERVKGPGQVCYEDLPSVLLERTENSVFYRTISPRHFEASALGVCQILFEGHYSGILQPCEHYIPLKKDFSNFSEVIKLFSDSTTRERIRESAFQELIASGKYSYKSFINKFDSVLKENELIPNPDSSKYTEISKILDAGSFQRTLRVQGRNLLRTQFPGRKFLGQLKRWVCS